jgi:hypothetical protein
MSIKNPLRIRVVLLCIFLAVSPFFVYFSFQFGAIFADALIFADATLRLPEAPSHYLWFKAFHITCILSGIGYVLWELSHVSYRQPSHVENVLGKNQ